MKAKLLSQAVGNESEATNSSEPIRVEVNNPGSGKNKIGTTKFVFFAGLFTGSMLVSLKVRELFEVPS